MFEIVLYGPARHLTRPNDTSYRAYLPGGRLPDRVSGGSTSTSTNDPREALAGLLASCLGRPPPNAPGSATTFSADCIGAGRIKTTPRPHPLSVSVPLGRVTL